MSRVKNYRHSETNSLLSVVDCNEPISPMDKKYLQRGKLSDVKRFKVDGAMMKKFKWIEVMDGTSYEVISRDDEVVGDVVIESSGDPLNVDSLSPVDRDNLVYESPTGHKYYLNDPYYDPDSAEVGNLFQRKCHCGSSDVVLAVAASGGAARFMKLNDSRFRKKNISLYKPQMGWFENVFVKDINPIKCVVLDLIGGDSDLVYVVSINGSVPIDQSGVVTPTSKKSSSKPVAVPRELSMTSDLPKVDAIEDVPSRLSENEDLLTPEASSNGKAAVAGLDAIRGERSNADFLAEISNSLERNAAYVEMVERLKILKDIAYIYTTFEPYISSDCPNRDLVLAECDRMLKLVLEPK